MSKNNLIDNVDGNTMSSAIKVAMSSGKSSPEHFDLKICTAYFSPTVIKNIEKYLNQAKSIKLLLGTEVQESNSTLNGVFSATNKQQIKNSIDLAIVKERNNITFNLRNIKTVDTMLKMVKQGKLEVKLYQEGFLHAKTYILNSETHEDQSVVFIGSSNFSWNGFNENIELNIRNQTEDGIIEANKWYDEQWEKAEHYDLAEIYDPMLELQDPYVMFLYVLFNLYGSEVKSFLEQDSEIQLTEFQRHGVARALNIIKKHGGVIVADEVGLGKTFIAGEIIKRYQNKWRRALLIAPASLRDTTWKSFSSKHLRYVECISYEELVVDPQIVKLMGSQDADIVERNRRPKDKLKQHINDYELVVIDEAHNYRNQASRKRFLALDALLTARSRDLLLLTATPVNNSLIDMYNLLSYFIKEDSRFGAIGIPSLYGLFKEAANTEPYELSPDMLFPVLDATTVKRTRQFVKKHYPYETIINSAGKRQKITFPSPHAITVKYKVTTAMSRMIAELDEMMFNESSDRYITLSRYQVDKHLATVIEKQPNFTFTILLRYTLIKRLESSLYAFSSTIDNMILQHKMFLDGLKEGKILRTELLKMLTTDSDLSLFELLESDNTIEDATRYDVAKLGGEVAADLCNLEYLRDMLTASIDEKDEKLEALKLELIKISNNVVVGTTDEGIANDKRKVIIFSYYADTVKHVYKHVMEMVGSCPELQCYNGRVLAVWGQESTNGEDPMTAVKRFAPKSMEAPGEQDDFDILITTDILAEGVNLQQCQNIINYDLPWNPMRLVQRHGRIDRINSAHEDVYLRSIFPSSELDSLLNLMLKIEHKLKYANSAVGVISPIEGISSGQQNFATIKGLFDGKNDIFKEGRSIKEIQTSEEYRKLLYDVMKKDGTYFDKVAHKAGAGLISGSVQGFFFCAKVLDKVILRFVRSAGNWMPVKDKDSIERSEAACLRLIECTNDSESFDENGDLLNHAYDFWELARQDIHGEWDKLTDPAAFQPSLDKINHDVIGFIRSHVPKDMPRPIFKDALDLLSFSKWSNRYVSMLRKWHANRDKEDPESHSRILIEKITSCGLEKVEPPKPYPPIQIDDIKLLCWIAIKPEKL